MFLTPVIITPSFRCSPIASAPTNQAVVKVNSARQDRITMNWRDAEQTNQPIIPSNYTSAASKFMKDPKGKKYLEDQKERPSPLVPRPSVLRDSPVKFVNFTTHETLATRTNWEGIEAPSDQDMLDWYKRGCTGLEECKLIAWHMKNLGENSQGSLSTLTSQFIPFDLVERLSRITQHHYINDPSCSATEKQQRSALIRRIWDHQASGDQENLILVGFDQIRELPEAIAFRLVQRATFVDFPELRKLPSSFDQAFETLDLCGTTAPDLTFRAIHCKDGTFWEQTIDYAAGWFLKFQMIQGRPRTADVFYPDSQTKAKNQYKGTR